MSDTLLGPALQQLVQLHAQPSTAAPNVGSPPVVMPAQMPVPPVRTVDPQVPTNAVPPNPNPEFVPSTTAGSQVPFPSTPIPVQPADLGNPNTPVDPLQRNDPWRNWYSPSRTAGFPNELAGVTRSQWSTTFCIRSELEWSECSTTSGNHRSFRTPIHRRSAAHPNRHPTWVNERWCRRVKRSERWMPSVPTPSCEEWKTRAGEITGFLNWLTTLASCGPAWDPTRILRRL